MFIYFHIQVSGLRQHGYAFVHFENTPDGKKSALAAAALSKEAPFQHNGVLFHAEVSKNFRCVCLLIILLSLF
jgi:hypothetical protein